jgi:hypothetical protein
VLHRANIGLIRSLAVLVAFALLLAPGVQAVASLAYQSESGTHCGAGADVIGETLPHKHSGAAGAHACPDSLPCCLACSIFVSAVTPTSVVVRVGSAGQPVAYPIVHSHDRYGLNATPPLPPPRRIG